MKINLSLTVREVNMVLSGLSKLPYETVSELISSVKTQGETQFKAAVEAQEAGKE